MPTCFLACGPGAEGERKLAAISAPFEFQPGSSIFLSGCEANAVWTLYEGNVIVSVRRGPARVRFGRGIYGLTEAIAGISYQTSVFAESYCRCSRVVRRDLLKYLVEDRRACLLLMEELARNHLSLVKGLAG